MNKVITMSDSSYFKYGELFIKTRKRVNAEFVLYGPDLTDEQIKNLKDNDIEYRHIDRELFDTKMQFLKFKLLTDNMEDGVKGLSFIDFDTFFMDDWGGIFKDDFALGVTVRNYCVSRGMLRAFANGGVIFANNSDDSRKMCEFAMKVMSNGGDELLPEYDQIFKTLEEGRPAHKTHTRETLRWWVDQVFLSSLVLRNGKDVIEKTKFYDFDDLMIGLFNCDVYNRLDRDPSDASGCYIVHLKDKGRNSMKEFKKAANV
jgi:hypothetical protein